MRALAILVLLCGPLLSAPAAVGLWAWSLSAGKPNADAYALGAFAAGGLVVFVLLQRKGLVREMTVLALSIFWTAWLWFGLTQRGYDWSRAPALHLPDRMERIPLLAMALAYLALYVVAEMRPARRVS